ncbi:557_t:CDS:1, partial [Funneliformis geosporum]
VLEAIFSSEDKSLLGCLAKLEKILSYYFAFLSDLAETFLLDFFC